MAAQTSPPPRVFEIGALLAGKYRVERVSGEGGIGVVLAAMHEQLEQRVAVKYLKPRARRSRASSERFVREARLAAKLQSEHIVRVHDVAVADDGTPYIVMEFLEGEDLATVLERGPLPIAAAVDLVLQACEALGEMHASGIVHRDLKPENLFVARRAAAPPVLKVLDLGISKVLDKHPRSKKEARLTGLSERFGTPQYMPPEQLNASTDVDARADIWALGAILHELVTGAAPFDADSIPELCVKIMTCEYPGLGARSDAPAGLARVIARCLAKRREDRYRNVAELALELARYGEGRGHERAERAAIAIRSGGESIRVRPMTAPPPATRAAEPPRIAPQTASAWGDIPPRPPSHGRGAALGVAAVLLVLALGATGIAQVVLHVAPAAPHVGRALAAPVQVARAHSSPSSSLAPATPAAIETSLPIADTPAEPMPPPPHAKPRPTRRR